MDELKQAIGSAMSGIEAEAAVSATRAQIREWGLSMPPIEPLPFDFGLGDFRNTGEVEFWIANRVEAAYCGKQMHSHRREALRRSQLALQCIPPVMLTLD